METEHLTVQQYLETKMVTQGDIGIYKMHVIKLTPLIAKALQYVGENKN